jgi:hypothetical protein
LDNGETFEPFIDLSSNTGDSRSPQMVVQSTQQLSTLQENPNSEIQTTNPQIQTTNPTQQTVSVVAIQQQPSGEDSSIITHQGTEEDLSALEKIEKLKTQYVELY